jgi:hypothetical protein
MIGSVSKMRRPEDRIRKKVCIVVVNYNCKILLKNLLDSITVRTTFTDYQLVLVDNGSTDGSVELVRKSYPWVRSQRAKFLKMQYGFNTAKLQTWFKWKNADIPLRYMHENEEEVANYMREKQVTITNYL